MNEWRVIAVLLAIIVLFSVILGIKITRTNSEQQFSSIRNDENREEEVNIQDNTSLTSFSERVEEYRKLREENYKKQQQIKRTTEIMLFVLGTVIIVSQFIIFYKMNIDNVLIKRAIILFIALVVSMIISTEIVMYVIAFIFIIFYFKLIENMCKEIGENPLLVIVPIINLKIVWELGAHFNKGIGFRLGLILLPFIFYPILAFSTNE